MPRFAAQAQAARATGKYFFLTQPGGLSGQTRTVGASSASETSATQHLRKKGVEMSTEISSLWIQTLSEKVLKPPNYSK